MEKVRDIMTPHPIVLNINDGLPKANSEFTKHHVRHLPVVDNGKLVGILSFTDIMRLSFGDVYQGEGADMDIEGTLFDMLTIDQVMKHHPKTLSPNDTIKQAAQVLTEHEFHALPVVEDGKLLGIITTTDIIRTLISKI